MNKRIPILLALLLILNCITAYHGHSEDIQTIDISEMIPVGTESEFRYYPVDGYPLDESSYGVDIIVNYWDLPIVVDENIVWGTPLDEEDFTSVFYETDCVISYDDMTIVPIDEYILMPTSEEQIHIMTNELPPATCIILVGLITDTGGLTITAKGLLSVFVKFIISE